MVGFLLRKILGGTPKVRRNTVAKYWLDENPHLKAINNVPSWHFLSQNFAPFWEEKLIPLICQRQKRTGFKPGTSPSKIAWATFPNTSLLPRQRRTARAR